MEEKTRKELLLLVKSINGYLWFLFIICGWFPMLSIIIGSFFQPTLLDFFLHGDIKQQHFFYQIVFVSIASILILFISHYFSKKVANFAVIEETSESVKFYKHIGGFRIIAIILGLIVGGIASVFIIFRIVPNITSYFEIQYSSNDSKKILTYLKEEYSLVNDFKQKS